MPPRSAGCSSSSKVAAMCAGQHVRHRLHGVAGLHQVDFRARQRRQFARRQQAQALRHPGHVGHRDRQPGHDRRMRPGQRCAGVGDAVAPARLLQRPQHVAAPGAAVALHRQRERQRVHPVRRVPGGGDPAQRPFPKPHRRPALRLVPVRTERQIQFAVAQLLHHLVGRRAQHVHIDRRVGQGEAAQHPGQVAQRVVVGRAEPHRALHGGRGRRSRSRR